MEYLRLSYSSTNVFESCARKFELDKLYPHPRIREAGFAADVGTALHAGYQDYLVNQDAERAEWIMMQKYPFEMEYFEQNDYRSAEAALATLQEMIASHSMGDYQLAEIKRPPTQAEIQEGQTEGVVVPAIEVPFEVRFEGITLPPTPKYPDGCGISFIGYIDMIMRNLLTDMYRTGDIKIHRDYLKDRTAKYRFDSQQTPYGIVVDHVSGQQGSDFEVLYYDCFVDLLDPKVKLYSFKRTHNDLQEWLLTKIMQFQSMQRFITNDFFPRTSGGCMFYNRPCRYLDPCTSRDRDTLVNWFMMSETEPAKEEEWNPWIVTSINAFEEE